MTVRFRRAGVDDMADIVELSAILFQEDAGERDPTVNLRWPEDEGREYFAGLVDGESSVCLLAEIGGDVVGYLAGRLREKHRGQGVGEGLIEEFFAWAGAWGARSGRRSRRMRLMGARSISTKGVGSGPGTCRWRGGSGDPGSRFGTLPGVYARRDDGRLSR